MSEHAGALNELRARLLADYEEHVREHGKVPLTTWLIEEIRKREAHIEALEKERADLRAMGHADLQALGHRRDYALAAYILKGTETTRRAGLIDLCYALSRGGSACSGDWDGVRGLWWAAALHGEEEK